MLNQLQVEEKKAKKQEINEDAAFRAQTVGVDQLGTEQAMNEYKNGVFILCTPTIGTPNLIDPETMDVPDGLMTQEKYESSFDNTIKPRVLTVHAFPLNGIKSILLHCQENRPKVSNQEEFVERTHYDAFCEKHSDMVEDSVIPVELYEEFKQKDIPAAFYCYKAGEEIQTVAVFGKQINSPVGNKLTDSGCYSNREQDIEVVNALLARLDKPSLKDILAKEKLCEREEKKEVNKI